MTRKIIFQDAPDARQANWKAYARELNTLNQRAFDVFQQKFEQEKSIKDEDKAVVAYKKLRLKFAGKIEKFATLSKATRYLAYHILLDRSFTE